MLLQELKDMCAKDFAGVYRAYSGSWRKAYNGKLYLRFCLFDSSGKIRAHGWEKTYRGPESIPNKCEILVEGQLRSFNNAWIADIRRAEIITSINDKIIEHNHADLCEKKHGLFSRINRLKITALQDFSFSILNNAEIFEKFTIIPASKNYHHSYRSGLLFHSLECWDSIEGSSIIDDSAKEIAMVAALFHDIGKIKTILPDHSFHPRAKIIDHNHLTLEILAPYLAELDKRWESGADALRHIWVWLGKYAKDRGIPAFPEAELVSMADRYSVGKEAQRAAFSRKPERITFSYYNGRPHWRPDLPHIR
ncbi:HD domain-containing protein [Geoalkalibacter ferrihydriticus]|uniref:HD domain-containing protein n=1 Tax=Geoalkalibacter ferrihydriticus TaxID=392333 RepID=A0A1G9QN37_9BACT|nr:HD domain-containing protein [Geoalkalibacter ferrihydriticus]SDM12406.1 HD domain-containing protein [Geoalkalibacter ferrihydriticus]